jgi:SagB-type dehydrogenase family enzyme
VEWQDLGSPQPRPVPRRYSNVQWPEGNRLPLSSPDARYPKTFSEVSRLRKSRRNFSALGQARLGELLSLSCRVRTVTTGECGFLLTSRPTPSAGAIHPIHVVAIEPGAGTWLRYDAFTHELVEIPTSLSPAVVRSSLDQVLPAQLATILFFIAEPGKTAAKYECSASLVWRDAGALQGHLSAAAEALGLAFCLLGINGEPWASSIVDEPGLVGVGVAYVGESMPS